MPELARILLSGDLSPKWLNVERHMCAHESAAVTRIGGTPEETLAYCRRLVPCVLVVDEAFTEKVSVEKFCDAVDFGRSIRVLVEIENQSFGKTEHLVRMGCAGVLNRNARQATAFRALERLLDGELWVDRKTVSTVVQNALHDIKCKLTFRETELLGLLAEGLKNHQIAERLFISPQTVRWHLRVLYSKLGTHDRFSAVNRMPPRVERDSSAPYRPQRANSKDAVFNLIWPFLMLSCAPTWSLFSLLAETPSF